MAGELILVVEDNEKNLKLFQDVLQFNGYKTVKAVSGEESLEIARAQQPALILMDIQLPGMDGITAFRRLRADSLTERIPVIAVTASVMTQDLTKISEEGFDGFQAKPIRVKEFTEEVQRVLSLRANPKSVG